MVTSTPPPDGLRHVHPMPIHISSPSRLSTALPLSPMRVAPAPAILDRSTPASLQKMFNTKSSMSPCVYDARPAYHHQETSPKTVPAIKIGNYTAPPLSPIRAVHASPSSQQVESVKKAAVQGEITQPLSPTRSPQYQKNPPQDKSPSHWQGSFYYKTSPQKKIPTTFQNVDVFAAEAVKAVGIPSKPSAQTIKPANNEAPKPVAETPAQSDKLRDVRVQALSPSPSRVRTCEAHSPERGDTSFPSLRLQDENSQSQWDKRVDQEDGSTRDKILPLILQSSLPASTAGDTQTWAREAGLHDDIQHLLPSSLLPSASLSSSLLPSASLSKSTSCLSPQPSSATPASDVNLARSVNRLSPTKKASRRNSCVQVEQLFDQDKDRFKKLTGRPTNFHIRTSDGYSIPAHKENLMVFTNLLDEHARTRKAIDVPETYLTWRYVLPYCYPNMEASALADASTDWYILLQCLVAAEKYGMLDNRGMERLTTTTYTYLENLVREENPKMLRIYDYPDSEKVQQWQRKHWQLAAKLFKHSGPLDASVSAATLKALENGSFSPLRLSEK